MRATLLTIVGFTLCGAATPYTQLQIEEYSRYIDEYRTSQWATKYSMEAYFRNAEEIARHNSAFQTYSKGVNQFTGLHQGGLMTKGDTYKCPAEGDVFSSIIPVLETDFDWRLNGVSGTVHEQGRQGMGMTHAAVAAVEQGHQMKYKSDSKVFSNQQVLDCLKS